MSETRKALCLFRQYRDLFIEGIDKAVKNEIITQKQRDILYSRFVDRMSLELTGQKFGVSRERIRQIESVALSKLEKGEEIIKEEKKKV